MAADVWSTEDSPDSLWEICLSYCVLHLDTLADYDQHMDRYCMRPGVTLPRQISENLLITFSKNNIKLTDKYLHLFSDPRQTNLKRISVRNCEISDESVRWLASHRPVELDISHCTHCDSHPLTSEAVSAINEHGSSLAALHIGTTHGLFNNLDIQAFGADDQEMIFGGDYVFDCPNLQAFSLHAVTDDMDFFRAHDLIATILNPLKRLSYLDLSSCDIDITLMDCLDDMSNLTHLVLYNVHVSDIQGAFNVIGRLKNLRQVFTQIL